MAGDKILDKQIIKKWWFLGYRGSYLWCYWIIYARHYDN